MLADRFTLVGTTKSKRKEDSAMNSTKPAPKVSGGGGLIFRAWYIDKDGNRVLAKDYGLKAWPLKIRKPKG